MGFSFSLRKVFLNLPTSFWLIYRLSFVHRLRSWQPGDALLPSSGGTELRFQAESAFWFRRHQNAIYENAFIRITYNSPGCQGICCFSRLSLDFGQKIATSGPDYPSFPELLYMKALSVYTGEDKIGRNHGTKEQDNNRRYRNQG